MINKINKTLILVDFLHIYSTNMCIRHICQHQLMLIKYRNIRNYDKQLINSISYILIFNISIYIPPLLIEYKVKLIFSIKMKFLNNLS